MSKDIFSGIKPGGRGQFMKNCVKKKLIMDLRKISMCHLIVMVLTCFSLGGISWLLHAFTNASCKLVLIDLK